MHLSYAWLVASAALLGFANSVYHPADYAILAAHMDPARMGRAFSIHTFAGFARRARVAPAVIWACWLQPSAASAPLDVVAGAIGLALVAGCC